MQRISFNIDGKRVPDREYLFKTLVNINPTTVGVMDSLELAHDIKALLPNALVWHREYDDSEAYKDRSPRELAEDYAGKGYGDVYAYNINEPVPGGDHSWDFILDWLIGLMYETRQRGVRCVVGNIGPGIIEKHQIFSAALFDDYLRALAAHDGWHVGGWHDYTGPLLPWGLGYGGRKWRDLLKPDLVQPDRWTRADEIRMTGNNWHLLRWLWLDQRCLDKGIKIHKKVISEFGHDRMPDLENAYWHPVNIYRELTLRYGVPEPHRELRGPNTLRRVYAALFPQWTFDEALFAQYVWADQVYPKSVIGFNLFQWTPGTPDWDVDFGFDVSRLHELHRLLADYARTHPTQMGDPASHEANT